MAYREYIGSRYVPIFGRKNEDSIQWDNGSSYEPLTVVLHEGNSYTSRQYVPAGVDINDGTFWAQTGNYNAQVEAYRADVARFDGRITNVEEGLDNVQDDLTTELASVREDINEVKRRVDNDMLDISIPLITGSCTVVKTPENAFIVDCGETGDGATINRFLESKGIGILNAVIISHFHHDHYSGFSELLTHIDSTTDIYIQMELPSTNGDSAYYISALSELNRVVNENNLKTPVIPIDGHTYEYGNTKLTMYNTDINNRTAYENSWANNDSYEARATSNNNYSLITRFDYFNNSYVDCGDIEGAAQVANESKMKECSCAKIPHHMGNYMGWYKFFDNLNPDVWIFNIYNNDKVSIPDIYSIWASWHYRYCKYRDIKEMYCNAQEIVNVQISNDCIVKREGYYIASDGLTQTSVENENSYSLYMLIPCEYYNENPYILRFLTLQQFVKLAHSMPYNIQCSMSGTSDFLGGSAIYAAIAKIFENYTDGRTQTFRITGGNAALTCKINTAYGQYYCAEIYNSVDPDRKYGYRLYTEGSNANAYYELSSPLTTGSAIPTAIADNVLHCNRLGCKLDSGYWLVCDKVPPTNHDIMPTTGRQWYRGTYQSVGNPNVIYMIEIHGSNVQSAKIVNTRTDEITDTNINAFLVVD